MSIYKASPQSIVSTHGATLQSSVSTRAATHQSIVSTRGATHQSITSTHGQTHLSTTSTRGVDILLLWRKSIYQYLPYDIKSKNAVLSTYMFASMVKSFLSLPRMMLYFSWSSSRSVACNKPQEENVTTRS